MLQANAVDPRLSELLKFAMAQPELNGLRLAGGTALALRLGHRLSVDVDLFGTIDFTTVDVADVLGRYGRAELIQRSRNIEIYAVDGIKTEIVNYRWEWLRPTLDVDNIRMAASEDIAAMKLNAVSGRGSRKVFIDIYAMLKNYGAGPLVFTSKFEFHDQSVNDQTDFM